MIARSAFGEHPSGRVVEAITCENSNGVRVRFLTYGGVIQTLHTPDRTGRAADIVLGFDFLAEYLHNPFYFGALIGRNANRIARGRFSLDGHEYALTVNDPPNHLHGGQLGLHQALWEADTFEHAGSRGAVLAATSAAGDDGYPGTVSVRVTYTLNDANEFVIAYCAEPDAPTPINLTQHTYFNLSGASGSSILDHELRIGASRYTPVDSTLIPLGTQEAVDGTPFDFRVGRPIARDLGADAIAGNAQLRLGAGYDHNWVLDRDATTNDSLIPAAMLSHASSGRTVAISTTERGLQVYAGGTFTPELVGKGSVEYPVNGGIAMETQAFPDAPNQPIFPRTIVQPGSAYRSTTTWQFGVLP